MTLDDVTVDQTSEAKNVTPDSEREVSIEEVLEQNMQRFGEVAVTHTFPVESVWAFRRIAEKYPAELANRILFNPVEPTDEQLQEFKDAHLGIAEQEADNFVARIIGGEHVFRASVGGMHSGKTQIFEKIRDGLLENLDFDGQVVAGLAFADEYYNKVTGNMEEAIPITSLQDVKTLGLEKGDVLLLDEFTFTDGTEFQQVLEYLLRNRISAYFTGITEDTLGNMLPGMKVILQAEIETHEARSFIALSENAYINNGTRSIRYLDFDGFQVLDLGMGRMRILSAKDGAVRYLPINNDTHPITLLAKQNPKLAAYIQTFSALDELPDDQLTVEERAIKFARDRIGDLLDN